MHTADGTEGKVDSVHDRSGAASCATTPTSSPGLMNKVHPRSDCVRISS